jgi:type II secretory pathway pseudopilin PulG
MRADLAALTPPLVVCVAFGIGVALLLRNQLAPKRRAARAQQTEQAEQAEQVEQPNAPGRQERWPEGYEHNTQDNADGPGPRS